MWMGALIVAMNFPSLFGETFSRPITVFDNLKPDAATGYEASQWFCAGLRKSTPVEIIDKLNKAIEAGIADPEIKARIAKLGATPVRGSPTDFGKFIADETEKWGKVIRVADIKAE